MLDVWLRGLNPHSSFHDVLKSVGIQDIQYVNDSWHQIVNNSSDDHCHYGV